MITEKQKIKYSLLFPLLCLAVMWLIKLVETIEDIDFSYLGIVPRQIEGLIGIVTSPFIHGDISHLSANSIPFAVLSVSLFYFYRGISYRIFFLIYFTVGAGVWIFGRPYYHIGASGVVYGLAAFTFFSGVLRKYIPLMALALLVIFLYGSMFWGIFPFKPNISWEAHLAGFSSGSIFAFVYRKQGPQRKPYDWELEDDQPTPEIQPDGTMVNIDNPTTVVTSTTTNNMSVNDMFSAPTTTSDSDIQYQTPDDKDKM